MKRKTKEIAICGGKGGTGKSTIACLIANKLARKNKKIILCDCDVECPNDYLLLNTTLRKPAEKTYTEFPKLDKRKCRKCGLCVKYCRNNAIFQAPGKYPIFLKDFCLGCGLCEMVCPFKAIKTVKEETGKIFINKIDKNFWLITGSAKPGLEETGPIVRQVKKFALKFAKKIKADIVLLDTAAGTHCPVISALLGSDYAYAVTEPTPMGIHDLDIILNLTKKLEIPTEIIINQANLGDKRKIEKIAKKYKTSIKEEVPFSEKIAKAYSKGSLLELDDYLRRIKVL